MSETEQFWRKHLDAIDASGLTTKVYAEQNQLKAIESDRAIQVAQSFPATG